MKTNVSGWTARTALPALLAMVTAWLPARAAKPNILFIMSDDHAAHAIGAYGGRLAKLNPTPVIDQLASEGMVMENAFCNNAICTPSRASIMTGQYSAVNGILTLNKAMDYEHLYLPREMKKAGYQTAVIGKWHIGRSAPPVEAFDYHKIFKGQGAYYNTTFDFVTGKDGPVRGEGQSSDIITDSVLAWLKGRDKTKPFFLMHHFKAPHDTFGYAERYEDYLADVHIPEPENLGKHGNHGSLATRGVDGELRPYIGSSIGRRHTKTNYDGKWADSTGLNDEQALKLAYQTYLRRYLRCVKGIDDNIKRVIDYLKDEGIYNNTVVVYSSDQGFYLGEHDYRDKRWGYEEAMRTPFIVRYPKSIKAGTRSDAIVENVDFAPTLLDFAKVATPDYMQGKSFRPILETGKEPEGWKQEAFYHYWMHMVHHYNPAHIAIRTKEFKLIMFYGTGPKDSEVDTPPAWELYNLDADPGEMDNLYDNPEYQEVVEKLKKQLANLRHRIGDDDPKFPFNQVIEDFWDYDAEDRARAEQISGEAAKRWEEKITALKQKNTKPPRKKGK